MTRAESFPASIYSGARVSERSAWRHNMAANWRRAISRRLHRRERRADAISDDVVNSLGLHRRRLNIATGEPCIDVRSDESALRSGAFRRCRSYRLWRVACRLPVCSPSIAASSLRRSAGRPSSPPRSETTVVTVQVSCRRPLVVRVVQRPTASRAAVR